MYNQFNRPSRRQGKPVADLPKRVLSASDEYDLRREEQLPADPVVIPPKVRCWTRLLAHLKRDRGHDGG